MKIYGARDAVVMIFHIAVRSSRRCRPNHKVWVPGSPSLLRPRKSRQGRDDHSCRRAQGRRGLGRHWIAGLISHQSFPFRFLKENRAGDLRHFAPQLRQMKNSPRTAHTINAPNAFLFFGGLSCTWAKRISNAATRAGRFPRRGTCTSWRPAKGCPFT